MLRLRRLAPLRPRLYDRNAGRGNAGGVAATLAAAMALLLGGAAGAWARDLHVAAPSPDAGAAALADGSAAHPFTHISSALREAKGGDRILLRPGDYGPVTIVGSRFARPVTVRPENDGRAGGRPVVLERLLVNNSANLAFERLSIWSPPGGREKKPLVETYDGVSDLIFRHLDLRSTEDATDYLNWSADDWLERKRSGARLRGARIVFEDNRLTGVDFGVEMWGVDGRVENNVIAGFAGDGLRGLGDGGVFRRNEVRDCIKLNGNHDDGFQSWSRGPDGKPGKGVVRDVTLDGNRIFEWTGPEDHPLHCQLQGIGMFDGRYEDWVIENNLVVVGHWHGITVSGGDRVRIVNNTVAHPSGRSHPDKPWIMLGPSKDGRPSVGGVVANNVASRFRVRSTGPDRPYARNNHRALYPPLAMAAPWAGDFAPKSGGPLVDAADTRYAPDHDMSGALRDNAPDIGAMELSAAGQ